MSLLNKCALIVQISVQISVLLLYTVKALPNTIRPLLVTYDASTTLEELARVADTLLDYSGSNQSVALVGEEKLDNISRIDNRPKYNNCDSRVRPSRDPGTQTNFERSASGDYSCQSIPT